jgi:hypothetical protein
MTYFVFDMDETLAELHSVYFFVASLRIKEILDENSIEITPALEHSLSTAYKIFVHDILKQETASPPLGILRPGILQVMERLYNLQKQDKIKNVLIYSNNGHLQSLEFIRDLIHEHLKTDRLITDCIHWNHHMRAEERTNEPGAANKTWNVLKNIMINGVTAAQPLSVEPTNVYFFDDLYHKDLQQHLGLNYYKVPAYDYKAPFDKISKIYMGALVKSSTNLNDFKRYVIRIFGGKLFYSMHDIIEMFRRKTGRTDDFLAAPTPDMGIEMMMEAIDRVEKVTGGARKRRRCTFHSVKRRSCRYRRKHTCKK